LNHCAQYIGVDIAERCVSYCRRTFGQLASKPRFLLGDGLSLASIADGSVSFVFTVDSLIHADRNCILAYAPEIHRVLEPGGHAFVHHSNLGEYVRNGMLQVANPNRRDSTLDAREAARIFSTAGLTLLVQETFQWCGGEAYSDCFTLMSKPSSAAVPRAPAIFKNERFGDEIKYCHFLASIYTAATQGH
jgi:SAM-dependent methyltransferase